MGMVGRALVLSLGVLISMVGMLVSLQLIVAINYPEPERTAMAVMGVVLYAAALLAFVMILYEAIKEGLKHYPKHSPYSYP